MIKREKGFILVAAMLALIVLGILIPYLIMMMRKDSKDMVSEKKKSTSFQLAEAGQDRGAWKLRESDTVWNNAVGGTTIPNYDGTMEFTDVSGGSYKVQFSTGPGVKQVTVLSKGKAIGTTDIRAIKAIYSKAEVIGAMSVEGGLDYKHNLNVHWGPVVSYTEVTTPPAQMYPRLFCAAGIDGWDTVNDSNNGAMPSGDWYNYNYATYYDLGVKPSINFDAYRALAKRSRCDLSKLTLDVPQTAADNGSCYFPGNVTFKKDFTLVCSTCVIFAEIGVPKFNNNVWLDVNALIAFNGDGDMNGKVMTYNNAKIPDKASDEYQYNTLVPPSTNPSYFVSKGWANGATVTIPDQIGIHGFYYIGGDMNNASGNGAMFGAIYIKGAMSVNTFTVYYDQNIGNNIQLVGAGVNRDSWDEILTSW